MGSYPGYMKIQWNGGTEGVVITPRTLHNPAVKEPSVLSHSTPEGVSYKTLDFVGLPKHAVGTDGSIWSAAKKWKSGGTLR